MEKRRNSCFARWRAPIISLAGALVALSVFSLALLGALGGLVSAQEPVRVEKTAWPETAETGDQIQYTVVFSNDTGVAVDIAVISDTLPTGFAFLALGGSSDIHDPPDGGATTGTLVWSDNGPYPVAANSVLRLVYNVRADAPASVTPYVNALEARLGTGAVISDSAEVNISGVELSGSKSASASQVPRGRTVDYTVSLHNAGTITATLSGITDTLPASFSFVQMVSGLAAPDVQGNILTWTGPFDIAAGGALEFSYRVRVDGAVNQTYQNSVQVTHAGGTEGPYQASVTVLAVKSFLPLVIKTSEPEEVYRLAYETKRGGNFEIYTIDADGSNDTNVSNAASGDLDPVWSPDGAQLAWVSFASGTGEIMVAKADGSNKINVSNHAKEDRTPAWSPDGARIAFSSYREDRWEVYLVDPDGSNLTKCTEPDGNQHQCQSHDPVWSPDGSKIAYICGLDQFAEIYIRNADCTGWERYTDNEVPDEALSWSPNSEQIVYVRYDGRNKKDSELYILTLANGTNTQLTANDYTDYTPAWSPDGSKIAFSTYLDGSYEIVTIKPDGSGLVNLTRTAKGDYIPKWSPDGLMLGFISNRYDDNKELFVMDADGSNQTRLTDTEANESAYNWRPQ